jgi:hypothetical protein
MAVLTLTRTAQARLGKASAPIDLKTHRLRQAALKVAVREHRWLEGDSLPDQADRLSFADLHRGMPVLELHGTASGRSGVIVGFKTIHGYAEKLPLIQWNNGLVSVSHPAVLTRQAEQLSLF